MTNPYRNTESVVPPGEPAKQRVEVVPLGPISAQDAGMPVKAVVVKEKPGTVNWFDKAKGYYHTLITVVGTILVFLNEVTPLTDSLGGTTQRWVSVVILASTALLNLLKSNEQWVNKP